MEPSKAILLITFFWWTGTEAKVFKKCDLARELYQKHGYTRSMLPSCKFDYFIAIIILIEFDVIIVFQISKGICMVEAESALDTKKVAPYPPIVGTEKPPYKSYGIFQVSNWTCS